MPDHSQVTLVMIAIINIYQFQNIHTVTNHIVTMKLLVMKIYIIFSGKFLIHLQSISEDKIGKTKPFINLASCGNEQLYNHLKNTIKQVYK